MKKCRNPECGKEIPEGLNYCNQECLRRHIELKKEAKFREACPESAKILENNANNESNRNTVKLVSEESNWLGQDRRKRAMATILKLAKELCPISYKHFACTVSYRTGLSLRKITDDYLEVLIELGLLKRNDNILILGEAES